MITAENMRKISENGGSECLLATMIYAAANLHMRSCKVGFISKKDIADLREAGYKIEFDEYSCCKISW